MEVQPVFIQDIFKPIVAKVSAKLLPSLQAFSPEITAVHYDYGHPLEIIETLSQKDAAGGEFIYKKYPLVMLVLDVEALRGREVGIYGEFNLQILIVNGTVSTYKAKQRDDNNFKPILTPIYLELMRQIRRSGDFLLTSEQIIPHRQYDRHYWGREGLWGNEGNIFNDFVDCVEIKDLKLKVKINYCPKPAI